jgi:glycerate-2-kinase
VKKVDNQKTDDGVFDSIEEEMRLFQAELEAEFEQKRQECRLAREEALLRLSEMERETVKKVEGEWAEKEQQLAVLDGKLVEEAREMRMIIAEKTLSGEEMETLLNEAFLLVLGEETA